MSLIGPRVFKKKDQGIAMYDNGMPVLCAEVVAVNRQWATGVVRILDIPERPDGLPTEVLIRSDHHCEPIPGDGKYGVDFGDRTSPREPKIGELMFVRRHHAHPQLVWQWCFRDEVPVRVVVEEPFPNLRGYKRRLAKRALAQAR